MPPRPRKQRRAQDRALRKAVRRTDAQAAGLPGGTAAHPLDVATAALVEPKARAASCPLCGGGFELRGDRATATSRGVLRAVDVVCRLCHAPRTLWFRIAPPATN